MGNRRIHTLLETKNVNSDEWTFSGIASTISPDRVGDIMQPRGAQFALPLSLLWQHDHERAVGHVTAAEADDTGIVIEAAITRPNADMPAAMADRLREAWASIKSGLIRGLSIGFIPRDFSPNKSGGGLTHTAYELIEISLVSVPANAEASISAVKAYDSPRIIHPNPYALPSGAFLLR